jgi:hypothetical protein
MAMFRPGFWFTTEESYRDYRNGFSKSPSKYVSYPTYRELVKNMTKHLKESIDGSISIHRQRRGEWGEWFEVWALDNGKAKIHKQGWM